jgi:hypothetical protein
MTTGRLPHCAALSRQLGERPTGTASRHKSVLLIEYPGTWPADVRERVLAEAFSADGPALLDELHAELGLRALVIRRPVRQSTPDRLSVFVGRMQPGHRWLERLTVHDYAELAGLDLAEVATGDGGFGEPVPHPLLLVCVHGRKDACCAIRGRPVAGALATAHPEQAWHCTHFGGDRWAGGLLVAPHGFMYGHLEPASALEAAQAAQAGRVALEHLRGRTGLHPFAQVAEIAIRQRVGLLGLDDVLTGRVTPIEPVSSEGSAARTGQVEDQRAQVEVFAGDTAYRVTVARRSLGLHGSSICAGEAHPYRFDVLDIDTAVRA